MTAPSAIKQSDLKRMAAIAKSEGVTVSIEVDGKIVKVSPAIPVIHSTEGLEPSVPSGGNALSEWRRLNESRFGGRTSRQKTAR